MKPLVGTPKMLGAVLASSASAGSMAARPDPAFAHFKDDLLKAGEKFLGRPPSGTVARHED